MPPTLLSHARHSMRTDLSFYNTDSLFPILERQERETRNSEGKLTTVIILSSFALIAAVLFFIAFVIWKRPIHRRGAAELLARDKKIIALMDNVTAPPSVASSSEDSVDENSSRGLQWKAGF